VKRPNLSLALEFDEGLLQAVDAGRRKPFTGSLESRKGRRRNPGADGQNLEGYLSF